MNRENRAQERKEPSPNPILLKKEKKYNNDINRNTIKKGFGVIWEHKREIQNEKKKRRNEENAWYLDVQYVKSR